MIPEARLLGFKDAKYMLLPDLTIYKYGYNQFNEIFKDYGNRNVSYNNGLTGFKSQSAPYV